MSEKPLVKFCLVTSIMVAVAFDVGAKTKSKSSPKAKTVGELLQGIERQAKDVRFNNKEKSSLPEFKKFESAKRVNLQEVKPPQSSKLYYDEGTNEAELEKITDDQIAQAYKLTQQFKTSKRRGELWLRLAELYVEKSRLIEYRLQTDYDEALKAHQSGRSKARPKLDLRPAQAYNKKAIQLYEWFLRDFPKDPKVDQALFFLGYNYFELGDEKKGRSYYEQITKDFPKSPFIDESNFALGEYHSEKEQWTEALAYYRKVAANKRARLFSFALYKAAWCFYKTGQVKQALSALEYVIRVGRVAKGSKDESSGGVGRIRLANEAVKDLVIFYAEVGTAQAARAYFDRVVGPKNSLNLIEKLAYYYTDTGNRDGARFLFKELVEVKPNAAKAYDYQYQIVNLYAAAGNNPVFKEELYHWITTYGPDSMWQQANRDNQGLTDKATQLIETTLRNYILQQHQAAQNSRAKYSQKMAEEGYELYFSSFKASSKLDEMHFFFGELLFDLQEYERAATHYTWVGDNAPKSKYYEKSLLNAVLALEKRLPSSQEIKRVVGNATGPVEFDKVMKGFERAATMYTKAYPTGEGSVAIRYKLGSIYYYYNQFDPALVIFNDIIKNHPQTQFAEFSANLILDIYNLKQDYVGLEKAGQQILAIPALASSPVGAQIQGILQRASFKKAQDLEGKKDYLKSAEAYESFAKGNAKSDLALKAYYNAGVNYERSGDLFRAVGMYTVILSSSAKGFESLKRNASKFVGALYEKTGQYAKAADAFESYANANSKDKEAVAFYYNAAVIRDAMNQYSAALTNYQKYFDKSRSRDRNEVLFLMAKLWERRGNKNQALGYYKQYVDANPSNGGALIEAVFAIAEIYKGKGSRKLADEWYGKTISIQRRIAKGSDSVGAPYAAESKFNLVYKLYEDLRSIRIPANPAKQAKALKDKLDLLNRLQKELEAVIKYDDAQQIVASLTLIGQAFQHMAAALHSAPVPAGLDAEGLKLYKAGIGEEAGKFEKKAIENYELAIARGRQLEGYNDWLKMSHRELAKLGNSKFQDAGEKVFLTTLPDWMGM